MKHVGKVLALILFGIASTAQAQLAAPTAFTGTYTSDLTCYAIPNATVDAWLASTPFKRGPTITPAGTHPLCGFSLRYDSIVNGGIPVPGLNPKELTHLLIDLDLKPGQSCLGTYTLPPPPYSFIPLLHQDDPGFVAASTFGFGYNAHLGTFVSTSTTFIGVTADVTAPLNYSGSFSNRTSVTGTGVTNLAYLAARLDAPVFGVLPGGVKVWNQVAWHATPANTQSEQSAVSWTSQLLVPGFTVINTGINNNKLGAIRLTSVPFESTIPVQCN